MLDASIMTTDEPIEFKAEIIYRNYYDYMSFYLNCVGYMRERGMGRARFIYQPATSVGGCLCCWALVISGNHYTVPMSMIHNVAWHNTPTLDTPFSYSPRSGGVGRAGTFGRARRKRPGLQTHHPPSPISTPQTFGNTWWMGWRWENIYAQQLTRAHPH